MGAPKGHPKYPGAGRKKGTPNKVTLGLRDEIERHLGKTLPAAIFERIARMDDEKACHALISLMAFVYPKCRTMEISGVNGGAIELTAIPTEQLIIEAKQAIKTLEHKA